jgi:DNA-binding NarL/FixJ family response regulator
MSSDSQSRAATRVAIVDDHQLFREGLRALLEVWPDIEVVGEGENGFEALTLAEEKHPDVVLMDLSMPGMNGIEATRQLRGAHPEIKVLVLSMHDEKAYAENMLEAGASGYVSKRIAIERLVEAIHTVAAGGVYSPAGEA